jgi:hypothetical protein
MACVTPLYRSPMIVMIPFHIDKQFRRTQLPDLDFWIRTKSWRHYNSRQIFPRNSKIQIIHEQI